MLKVVEAFSGIGAQKEALEKANIDHEILNTIEWDINAIYAYDVMHHGDLTPSSLSKEEILNKLKSLTLSANGKKVMTDRSLKQLREDKLQRLYAAIIRNKNLCDITKVTGEDLQEDIDLLTYSFPCQDLSNGSAWYNKDNGGIVKGSGSRSGLLWEVERILHEMVAQEKSLPKFLLMENVNAINSKNHKPHFEQWQRELNEMGYVNKVYKGLNALDYGIPQSRSRTFMLSVRSSEISEDDISNLESNIPSNLGDFLRFNMEDEAIAAAPNFTPSRRKIYDDNVKLAKNGVVLEKYAKTISTKQDRNPNAGVIVQNGKMRYLTPRETFLLMGFPERKFEKLIKVNNKSKYLKNEHFYRMSGNSIVVNILTEIFKEIERIKGEYF